MALTIKCDSEGSIEFNEYLEYVGNNVNPNCLDSIANSAELLKKLSNNTKFVTEMFNSQLKYLPKNLLAFYSSQSAILGVNGDASVRLNVWPLLSADPRRQKIECERYSYYDSHDHNFTFMTVGYFGPGYSTRLYEYDPERVIGYIGEKVDIRFLEETTLPKGKVMLYRPSIDIHMQIPPAEFSLSLNLMFNQKERTALTHQYFFDLDKRCISGYVESFSTKRVSCIEMLKLVGDENSIDVLWDIANKHPCNRTRLSAIDTIVHLKPAQYEAVWSIAANDADPLMNLIAKSKLIVGR